MSTSRIKASKTAIYKIQAMSNEELTQMLREKKSGSFAKAIREIADFSDVEYDLRYRSQPVGSLDITTDVEFCHKHLSFSENSWGLFDDLTTYEAANELLAA